MRLLKFSFPLLMFSIVLMSCEKQEYFKSESTIKSEIGHTWHRIQISHLDSPNEYWEFKDGAVSIYILNDTIASGVLQGSYSVKTSLTKVFVTTKDFKPAGVIYEGTKWQVIQLDDKVLQMAGEDPNSGTLLQREFTRQ